MELKKHLNYAISDGELLGLCAQANPDRTWADVENAYPWFGCSGTISFGEFTVNKEEGWFRTWLWAELQNAGIKHLIIYEEI